MTIYFRNRIIIIGGKGLVVPVGNDVSVPGDEMLPVAVAVKIGEKSVFLVACYWLLPRKL